MVHCGRNAYLYVEREVGMGRGDGGTLLHIALLAASAGGYRPWTIRGNNSPAVCTNCCKQHWQHSWAFAVILRFYVMKIPFFIHIYFFFYFCLVKLTGDK